MVGFTLNGTPYFYIRNLQNDVVGIYNSAGAIVVKYSYDAWGKLLDIVDTSGYNIGALNPILYRGYYYDTETGYYYCQSRYYNPIWCRWISADVYMDTVDGVLGTNMYAYCQNDAVNKWDPSGRESATATLIRTIPASGAAGAGLLTAMSSTFLPMLALSAVLAGNVGVEMLRQKFWENSNTRAAIGNIANNYGNLKCREAAEAMERYLKKNKQEYGIIGVIYPFGRGFITSDSYKGGKEAISKNGKHFGVTATALKKAVKSLQKWSKCSIIYA
jgi:RHS repeat-associated protein